MVNCVYIHIPFCEKKCRYCAFCSYTALSKRKEYTDKLIKEIKFHYKNETLKTLYFGGGTPTLLENDDIERILSCFKTNSNTEITFEANPNSIDKNKLLFLKRNKVNRISLGVQSFDDEILKVIGRIHSKKQIYEAVDNIKNAGFNNFSIDLMYGLPHQTIEQWEKTIDEALLINPPHISTYGLKIEKGTDFYKNTPKNLPDNDTQAKMYEILCKKLNENYIHYEFSNFAKKEEFESRHNLCYWTRQNYYGFGISASGFIENKRYTNTSNYAKYVKNPEERCFEELSKQNEIEEEIFLGLRLKKGIDFNLINEKYNIDIYKKFEKQFKKIIDCGFAQKTETGIKLTQKGILVSNEILCEFIEI